jgi:putative uncharacterized protein (fragment)
VKGLWWSEAKNFYLFTSCTEPVGRVARIQNFNMTLNKLSNQAISRLFLSGVALCFALTTQAQVNKKVAVGTRNPTETLDVNGTLRVAVLPEDGQELIFTTSDGKAAPEFNQRYTANRVVVADKNGVLGFAPSVPEGFFYMPPVLLPLSKFALDRDFTDASIYKMTGITYTTSGTFSVDLYKLYKKQFQNPQQKSSATSNLPVHEASNLNFFVIYYDSEVFSDVHVSPAGVLTYTVKKQPVNGVWKEIGPTEKTFMNVVFSLK